VLSGYVLDRESPGRSFRHVITKREVQSFVEILPDWMELSHRLERIVLAAPDASFDGAYEFYHREKTGAIFLHAWPDDLWVELSMNYFDEHLEIFKRLEISHDRGEKHVSVRFTEAQARAFMLLHVFLHELGHHHDRLLQKRKNDSGRGEEYAERFAMNRFNDMFPNYMQVFGDPRKGE
jgi:hypothetical protein